MTTVRIATRQSNLALWQANFIAAQLRAAHPGLVVELVGMTTQGDRWLETPLSEIGGKGLFVKELEAAMLDNRADLAVHSVKDLPAHMPDGFALPLLGFRGAVQDVLVSRAGDLAALPAGARVGSSSLRRQSQLLAQRSDLKVRPIRGNVETRLGKLEAGEFDAIVLAAAGLERLGLEPVGCHELSVDVCLPAPGQGALGVECLVDSPVHALLAPLKDAGAAECIEAERGISAGLGADCSMPVAAHAVRLADGTIHLKALLATIDGAQVIRAEARGDSPGQLAADAVAQLHAQGAAGILARLGSP